MKIPSLVCQALSLIFFQLLFCAVKGINVNAVLNGNAVLFGGQPNDYYPIVSFYTARKLPVIPATITCYMVIDWFFFTCVDNIKDIIWNESGTERKL